MAAAQIATTATNRGVNADSPSANYPSSIQAGDLLILCHVNDGTASQAAPSGFTELGSQQLSGTAVAIQHWYKFASGSESGSVSYGASGENFNNWMARITGAHASTPPEVAKADAGGTDVPDPPSVTASWGAEENRFITHVGIDGATGSSAVSTYPTGYSDNQFTQDSIDGGGAGTCAIGVCSKAATAASDNPGTFTMNRADNCAVATIVVRPAGAAAGHPAARRLGMIHGGRPVQIGVEGVGVN